MARINQVDTWRHFKSWLARPVNGASLAAFRIAVGLVMALEAWSLLRPSSSTNGEVMLETYYTGADVTFNFPYAWFEWLPFLPEKWIYSMVILLGLASLTMAAGLFYRISAALVFLSWGYLYAVESTRTYWMSYYYLELLITFLLIWMPAANRFSIDSIFWKKKQRADVVPFWTILLLRAQLVITYFYAGVAKLNADWLLDAMPVREFLERSPFFARFDSILPASAMQLARSIFQSEVLAYFLSYAGAVFDLCIGALLLYRRTRTAGLIALVLFHATNHFILFDDIIWFPLLGILTASIFLEPDWPERLFRWITRKKSPKRTGNRRAPAPQRASPLPIAPTVAPFIAAWIAIQALVPVRHYFIPGDARFTWEGLSFSWRLKAEWYRSALCEIYISDPEIVSPEPQGRVQINWSEWRGERVIYRRVKPGEIPWPLLPEIVVLFEPELGERILYNPLAGSQNRTEAQAVARVEEIWRSLYGRTPEKVQRTVPLSEIIAAFASGLRARGTTVPENFDAQVSQFLGLYGSRGTGKGIAVFRRTDPFALQGATATPAPFLLIEDADLFQQDQTRLPRIRANLWKALPSTSHESSRHVHLGGEPLIVHLAAPAPENRRLLPQVCLMDSVGQPVQPAQISWDYTNDLSRSKAMHISTNPFLLRRYAQRVAALWQQQYGRLSAVHAITGVSLNRRPPQQLVDPSADLARVRATHFRRNHWIKDLQLPRIPRESLRH